MSNTAAAAKAGRNLFAAASAARLRIGHWGVRNGESESETPSVGLIGRSRVLLKGACVPPRERSSNLAKVRTPTTVALHGGQRAEVRWEGRVPEAVQEVQVDDADLVRAQLREAGD